MEYGNAHTVRLASGWGKDLSKYTQLVFGELAKLAIPVVRHYHGDLYYDALWISNHITGTQPLTFYYGVRETGTNIGWFEETMTDGGNTGIYRCRVRMINHETCEMIIEEGRPDVGNGQAIAHGQALRQAAGNPGWHGGA